MVSKPDAIDQIDSASRPLLEIPAPLSDKAALMLSAAFSVGMAPVIAGFFLDLGLAEALLRPLPVFVLGCVFLVGMISARFQLSLANQPRFVVGMDGLWLRVGRTAHGLHFDWDDVTYCQWSRYEPGVLSIQISRVPARSGVTALPTRHFFLVPELYRSAVEKSLRAMGRWAEGESSPARVLTATLLVEPDDVKAAAIDEIDRPPVSLVEIPRSRWRIVASLLPLLLLASYSGMFLGTGLRFDGAGLSRRTPLGLWIEAAFTAIAAILMALALLRWASYPEFAVRKEGIRLPFQRRPGLSSGKYLLDLGLFPWDEVSYCRWSRYEEGLLQIQVRGTRSQNNIELPPTRLTYHVAEPYRDNVEKAIRAVGKWAK